MAKSVTFKKKPLKTEETEQKLDQWLEKKTGAETPATPQVQPEQQNGNEAQERASAPETVKTTAVETAPATAEEKTSPAKTTKKPVTFEKQEEELEIAQVTFHMPKSLQRRLKFECFRQDTTIKDYVIKLLDKQLPKDAR